MYIGYGRLFVCVCLSVPRCIPTLQYRPGCNLGGMVGVPSNCALADLQSVHGFRCYDNTHVRKLIALYTTNAYSTEREMSASR